MATGKKTGGRQKGTTNRDKQALIATIHEKFPDYHPIVAMCEIATDKSLDSNLRFQAHKEITQYIEPKRKAVDVNASLDGELRVILKSQA